ncbi:cyclophilin-like protein [Basidiobolus meristosporus CBS 931.73]|uniref:Peptidyl-prolyl cis-trans isomerase n=1 Tax=Basidiobolus meristosporus CBS 931.73 TaxID=1314790 RepID=A0A1Y1YW40_9FUNG|nr:cyclophilin-like protein [Basidiobolus meristosporus CBS 931.73]|eukprot:ORY02211.1 cyclophilin-like protein [Basidiobolus meristosporus CBS 931.73]
MNFLKLCKIKYYNFCCFHNVQKDFMLQTGDPTATGKGGESIFGLLKGPKYFPAEIHPKLKHKQRGTVSMAIAEDGEGGGVSGSQFFITTGENLDYLDGKYTVFGQVAEGFDTLDKINSVFCDETGRPLKDIRIKHTIILDDPFPDPEGLVVPDESPLPTKEMLETVHIGDDEDIEPTLPPEELERLQREREANAQALTLEMVGDLPFAEVKPPENVIFVCKLNPVTRDEDLELIFSRFGPIHSCEIIRDKVTNDSLGYGFVEFENKEDCEEAYFKMDNVLIDDRRIHVDFSQSVSKLHKDWVAGKIKSARDSEGYGGSSQLQKRQKYRAGERDDQEKFEMVFEHGDTYEHEKASSRSRRDSRSPERSSRSSRYDSERSRHRSPERRRDDSRRSRRDDDKYSSRNGHSRKYSSYDREKEDSSRRSSRHRHHSRDRR